MAERVDLAVVGAGIIGLAQAYSAARRGLSVVVYERSPAASGASVRNFGMIWPIGQAGELYRLARRSREMWLELARSAHFWINECGSLHLARHEDEWQVLSEFARLDYPGELLDAQSVLARFNGLHAPGLRGAWYSPTELCVDPRQVIAQLPRWLADEYGVRFQFGVAVRAIDAPFLETSLGKTVEASRIVVCSGVDFETLFPRVFAESGYRRCKLQMLRTGSQPAGWRLPAHIAGGLTLCHYDAFRLCPSLPELRRRFQRQMPEYLRYGIHVMASQNEFGEVVIGDSHEYDQDISPFDKSEIDELILVYLRQLIELPDWRIRERWHGIYAKPTNGPLFTASPQSGCWIVGTPGGAGMTLSLGWAEQLWESWA